MGADLIFFLFFLKRTINEKYPNQQQTQYKDRGGTRILKL